MISFVVIYIYYIEIKEKMQILVITKSNILFKIFFLQQSWIDWNKMCHNCCQIQNLGSIDCFWMGSIAFQPLLWLDRFLQLIYCFLDFDWKGNTTSDVWKIPGNFISTLAIQIAFVAYPVFVILGYLPRKKRYLCRCFTDLIDKYKE